MPFTAFTAKKNSCLNTAMAHDLNHVVLASLLALDPCHGECPPRPKTDYCQSSAAAEAGLASRHPNKFLWCCPLLQFQIGTRGLPDLRRRPTFNIVQALWQETMEMECLTAARAFKVLMRIIPADLPSYLCRSKLPFLGLV